MNHRDTETQIKVTERNIQHSTPNIAARVHAGAWKRLNAML